ncbi:MAG: ABC-F family ATP-binding cassette domain-containing protein [Candidatus Sericytochromatia bacterium]|nr:ABC-F family ATP-binding cassette domain-containing protein [Candidatus Sericytochromatia bacterium]
MLRLVDLHKSYPDKILFNDFNWNIHAGERYGLIGANGIGKTTMLRIIAGTELPDKGAIVSAPYVHTGYLAQSHAIDTPRTVREEMQDAFSSLQALEVEIAEVEADLERLGVGPAFDDLFPLYNELLVRLDWLDPYTVTSRIGKVAAGLGFSESDLDRPVSSFSGGWRVRVALGKLLLEAPNVLLLDEPTNHLDLEAINWLEGYLQSYPGTIILVSHDQHFLDAVVTRVVTFTVDKAIEVAGNYTHFKEHQIFERTNLISAKERQDKEMSRQQAFIERFRASATKSTQAKSREKMVAKVDRIKIPPDESTIGFRFPPPPVSGATVMRLVKLQKKYGERMIVSNNDPIEVPNGARIGILGRNGAGKTTLLRLIAGTEAVSGGKIEFGYNVLPGYYAQDQADTLNVNNTVWQEAQLAARKMKDQELRDLLARFLFRGNAIQKPISVLSGGERARLALCKLLLSPVNLLLMDEPTNHLDIASKDVLAEALNSFEGTIVMVSHDRHFIESTCQQTWIVGDGQLTTSQKTIKDWLASSDLPPASITVEAATKPAEPKAPPVSTAPKKGVSKKEVDKVMAAIAKNEAEINDLGLQLASGDLYKDPDNARAVGQRHKELQDMLETQFAKLEKLEAGR